MDTFRQFLSESPQIVSPTDFTLEDDSKNKKLADSLLKKKVDTLEDNKDYITFVTGNGIKGYVVLIDKDSGLIDYLSKYQRSTFKALHTNNFITQVVVWRRKGSINVQGITSKIFFDYYLNKYKAIMSDQLQTLDGKQFWMDQMAKAVQKGHKVGLADMNLKNIDFYDSSKETYNSWIKRMDKIGWGDDHKKITKRFVIFE
jgi:hypothetical protein